MPLYDYQCPCCDTVVDVLHKMSEKPQILCKSCDLEMTRVISACHFVLKGEGFYINDFKKTKGK